MLNTILRMFIPNYTDTENPDVRQRYGVFFWACLLWLVG